MLEGLPQAAAGRGCSAGGQGAVVRPTPWVTVLGVVIQCNGDRRRVAPKASAMADRAWKDLAMTEPHDIPQDTEPDPESSTDEPTAEANQEAGEDDLASGYKESGDTY